jgi:hypothetical protein
MNASASALQFLLLLVMGKLLSLSPATMRGE